MVLTSVIDELNKLSRKEIIDLKGLKRLKEREIINLFIGVFKIVKNIKIQYQEEKTLLAIKIKDLELRIKKLEEVKE